MTIAHRMCAASCVTAASLALVACGANMTEESTDQVSENVTEKNPTDSPPPGDMSEWPTSLQLDFDHSRDVDTAEAVDASLAHSIDLLQSRSQEGNNAISPASLTYAFAIAADGATCETVDELNSFLGVTDDNRAEVYTYLAQKFVSLNDANSETLTANMSAVVLDVEPDGTVDPAKARTIAQTYGAGFSTGTAADMTGTANEWVNRTTNGLQTELPIPLPQDTALGIVTTYMADTEWEETGEDATIEFTFLDGTREDVAGIDFTVDARGQRAKAGWVITLPTKSGAESLIYYPDENVDPLTLDETAWEVDADEPERIVDLTIPEVSVKDQVDVLAQAEELGIESIGGTVDGCQLSGFAHDGETVTAEIIVQGVTLDLDKEGVRSSAVTEIIGVEGAAPSEDEPVRIVVDRPYTFITRDPVTKWVTLYATIADPTAAAN